MRVYRLHRFGLENLKLELSPDPCPGRGELLIEVRALSLNYRDLLVIRGEYNPKLPLPGTPLSDGSGVVLAAGAGVTEFKPGDRVVSHYLPAWQGGEFRFEYLRSALGMPGPGMAAERVVLPAAALAPLPAELDFEQGATLPVAALTAWSALVEVGGLAEPAAPDARLDVAKPAEFAGARERVAARAKAPHSQSTASGDPPPTVLTLGAGGVSMFVLQIGKALGARVIITSSSDEKLARARELGADETINYRSRPDWEKAVLERTGGLGVDITVETGGAGTLEQSLRATRAAGRIAFLGSVAGLRGEVSLAPLMMKRIRVEGVVVSSREQFLRMLPFLVKHSIRPVIGRRFRFEELPSALREIESAAHFGKIVVRGPGATAL